MLLFSGSKDSKPELRTVAEQGFLSCCLYPHYSSKRRDIWLERNFTKPFVLTQCQHGITQTRVILPELAKPCSHPKRMPMVQHKTAASRQSSCPAVYVQQAFFRLHILTGYNLRAALCSSHRAAPAP